MKSFLPVSFFVSPIRLFFLFIFTSFLFSFSIKSSASIIDDKIAIADSFFNVGKYENAIAGYRDIIKSTDLQKEYTSLFLLRIAYAQKYWGKTDECRTTLNEIKSLKNIPEHRLMEITGLEAEISGKSDPALNKTIKPSFDKIAARIFVSTKTGSENSNGSKKSPVKSIGKALEKARELRKNPDLPEGIIEIALLDKVYNIKETLVFETTDSGTKRNPLVIKPVDPKVHVLLTGGCPVKNWKTENDPEILKYFPKNIRGKVLVASLSDNGIPAFSELIFGGFSSARAEGTSSRFITMPVPELFYKNKAQIFSRWPNSEDTDLPLEGFSDERPLRWMNESNLWLHGYWYWKWADAYEKVDRISPDEKKIYLAPPVNKYGFKDSRWHVVNALSEIDMPGEWHINTINNTIHYLPPENFNPSECFLSVYGPIIKATECNYVAFERIDANFFRGDGMVFENCSDITITDCSLYGGSGTGLVIRGGLRHLIHTVSIEHMGRGGIDITAGDWIKLLPSGDIIENCRISDLSRIDRTYTPALLLDGMGFKLRYCCFKNIPSSAIRIEASESFVELNEFTDCVKESDDQGAIDVWANPLYRGNIVRWNYFHDITGRHGMVAGLRLDDAISGFMIYENIFLRSSGGPFGGIQIHGGKDSFVEGNIFIDCKTMISNSPWGNERWKKDLTTKGEIAGILERVPWQSSDWLKRYPALEHLMDGPADMNFLADNLAINVKTMHNWFSPNMRFYNHKQLEIQPSPDFKDIKKYLEPWHQIPLDKIGNY